MLRLFLGVETLEKPCCSIPIDKIYQASIEGRLFVLILTDAKGEIPLEIRTQVGSCQGNNNERY